MSYDLVHQTILDEFASQWATRQPTWDQATRIGWPLLDEPNHGRQSWLRVGLSDVDGFNRAVGVLDAEVSLFSIDIYVPLPEEATNQLAILALVVRNAMRSMAIPPQVLPRRVWKRDFGRTPDGFGHSRMNYSFQYDLPAVA